MELSAKDEDIRPVDVMVMAPCMFHQGRARGFTFLAAFLCSDKWLLRTLPVSPTYTHVISVTVTIADLIINASLVYIRIASPVEYHSIDS